jgi:hypothetical protein
MQYQQEQQQHYMPGQPYGDPQQSGSWSQAPVPAGMVGYDMSQAGQYYGAGGVPDISRSSRRPYSQDMPMAMTPIATAPPPSIARMSTPGIPAQYGQQGPYGENWRLILMTSCRSS